MQRQQEDKAGEGEGQEGAGGGGCTLMDNKQQKRRRNGAILRPAGLSHLLRDGAARWTGQKV